MSYCPEGKVSRDGLPTVSEASRLTSKGLGPFRKYSEIAPALPSSLASRQPNTHASLGRGCGLASYSDLSAIRISWTRDWAFILRIACPRCILTVTSLLPSSPAICLFSKPDTTSFITSRSRLVRDS
jgi:hypothetical protein